MRTQQSIYEMSDRELRSYRRALRLRRERRRKALTLFGAVMATLCLILVCTISYGSIQTKANSGYKYFTSITVESGETLWDIADNYIDYDYYKNKNAYIAEVCSINHLEEDGSITAGQTIVVPYYSAEFVY